MKRILYGLLVFVIGLITVLAINVVRQQSQQLQIPAATPIELDENLAATHLAQAIQFRTISSAQQPDLNAEEFAKFHAYLASTYPRIHQSLKREKVGQHSLLYTWLGSDPGA